MPDVFDWRNAPASDLLVQAVQHLAGGGLVVFPTDTCYLACASALISDAVRRLAELLPAAPLQIAVTGAGQAVDWVPEIPLRGQRLARRLWPGPMVMVFSANSCATALTQLPEEVSRLLVVDGRLQLRCPGHEAILQVLQYFPSPVACRPLLRADGSEITTAEELTQAPSVRIDLLITDGPTYFGQPATTVAVRETDWEILSPGVVREEELQRLSACQIIFVCTGNTCRSPLAEALCKKMLADQLACRSEELPARGFLVQSAGLLAMPGQQASSDAVAVAREFGADLAGHRSQALTGDLLLGADHVLTMTASHLGALAAHGLAMLRPPRLLSCEGEDVTDPIGAEPEIYRECARQIQHHLQRRLPEFRS